MNKETISIGVDYVAAAYAAGLREGQERMRERAIKACHGGEKTEGACANAIRALPLEEEELKP